MRLFKRRLLWYLLFGAFLLLALFWWTFPSEQVQRATVRTLEELLPGKVTVESVRLSFPLHLAMKNITFESGPLLIQLPDTRLVPDLMGFLRGGRRLRSAIPERRRDCAANIGWKGAEER